ncbi:MAG: hypothetical protein SO046_05670 [Actinomyces urogenitalis]|nr:hypothetical protein [Actinomyces urogenitalis]
MALLERVELLGRFVQQQGRWCASIEHEWCVSRDVLCLDGMDEAVRQVCGQPIFPDRGDHVEIQDLAMRMRAPGEARTKNLGEAETIVLIRRRQKYEGAIFLTDDRQARQFAEAEAAINRCLGTVELLAYFEAARWMTRDEVYDCLQVLRDEDRHVRPSDRRGYDRLVDGLMRRATRSREDV